MSMRSGPGGRLGALRYAGRIEGGRGVPTGPPRRYEGWALVYVFGGSGRYRDATHDVAIGPGSLVYVTPGHAHWYGVVGSGGWDEVFVAMDGPVFDLASTQGLLDTANPLRRLLPAKYWLERLDAFRIRRPPTTSAGADDEVCTLLRLLVEMSVRAERVGTPDRSVSPPTREVRGWLAASQARLTTDLGDRLDLAQVAAAVGMSYETWRKRFQAATGTPPSRWRLLRRVDAAGELLRRTSLSAAEIAASLGFSDGPHLSKSFRAATGMTTGEFRRTVG